MTTDFRALCAELLSELEHATHNEYQQDLKDRARAALAEPEPPTYEQLVEEIGQAYVPLIEALARAVLARWGS